MEKIFESFTTFSEKINEDSLEKLRKQKMKILKDVEPLIALKKKKYSNMDIESPKSSEEKELDAKINKLHSDVNKIVRQINKLKK